ncbi:hypothetical protein Agub_g3308, partial [Astrephomene gubernaculifera]
MLKSKLEPGGTRQQTEHKAFGPDLAWQGQAVTAPGEAPGARHATKVPPISGLNRSTTSISHGASLDVGMSAGWKDANSSHVDSHGPSRPMREGSPAGTGSRSQTGSGGSSQPKALKSSMKPGMSRIVRATGRPAEVESLPGRQPRSGSGSSPAQGQRQQSPDRMPPRLSNLGAGSGNLAAASLPSLSRRQAPALMTGLEAAANAAVAAVAATVYNGSHRTSSPAGAVPTAARPGRRMQPNSLNAMLGARVTSPGPDRAGGSAPNLGPSSQFPGAAAAAGNPPRLGSLGSFLGNAVGSASMKGAPGSLPFPFAMQQQGRGGSPTPGSGPGMRRSSPGARGRSPGFAKPRSPKRPGQHQQQTSSRISLSSRSGGRQADPTGVFEILTTAPGVIGEVRLSPELWCMDLWKLLDGCCPQQRVWTFGNAASTRAAVVEAGGLGAGAALGGLEGGGGGGGGAGMGGDADLVYTSPLPLALLNGVVFRFAAAGAHHGAAVSADGHLYVWGSDSRGQLGRGCLSAQHIASHQLPHEVLLPVEASLDDLQGHLPASLLQGIIASGAPKQPVDLLTDG